MGGHPQTLQIPDWCGGRTEYLPIRWARGDASAALSSWNPVKGAFPMADGVTPPEPLTPCPEPDPRKPFLERIAKALERR
jgi:hypothetical protein